MVVQSSGDRPKEQHGFLRSPAGISAIAAMLAALTGVAGLAIANAGHNSSTASQNSSTHNANPAVTDGPGAPQDDHATWAQAVNNVCAGVRPRLVSLAHGQGSFLQGIGNRDMTQNEIVQFSQFMDAQATVMLDLSSGLSRLPPPASIFADVQTAVNKLDSAVGHWQDAANGTRSGMTGPAIKPILERASDDTQTGLRKLGLLGASSCSDLI